MVNLEQTLGKRRLPTRLCTRKLEELVLKYPFNILKHLIPPIFDKIIQKIKIIKSMTP